MKPCDSWKKVEKKLQENNKSKIKKNCLTEKKSMNPKGKRNRIGKEKRKEDSKDVEVQKCFTLPYIVYPYPFFVNQYLGLMLQAYWSPFDLVCKCLH